MMWEYGEDGSGFVQRLATEGRAMGRCVVVDGCLVVHGELP
jgi:hypothetical protein